MSDILSLSPRVDAIQWIEHLSKMLSGYRFNFSNEKDLQAGLGKVFMKLDEVFFPEHRLSDEDIVDFYFPAKKIGVEAKIDHSLSDLTRQIHRYVQHDSILGILVVTSKARLANLPEEMNHKPIRCHSLLGSVL
jgi:hypothetical protein